MALRPRKPMSPDAARIKAEELCARAEHCSGEIMEKLLKWGLSPRDAGSVMEILKRRRFIDDSRFASAYARDKMEYSHWGKRKIALMLYKKRVERDIIDEALDSLDPDRYNEILRNVVAAKRRLLPEPDTYEGRTKIFRHAISKGFEPDLVAKAIRQQPS